MGAGVARFSLMHAAFQLQVAANLRHHRLVAVAADAHLNLVREVDAVDELQKSVHEMLTRHLAVADDVEAGILLHLDRQQRSVELGLREFVAGKLPLRPQLIWLGEPRWLRQAAGNTGRKHHALTPLTSL